MIRVFKLASTLISSLRPKSKKLKINTYDENTSGLTSEQIQDVMEWLFASLLNAGYSGEAHLIWADGFRGDWDIELKAIIRGEPVFLYRCGNRTYPLPEGYYWRLMPEYPSLRIYQLDRSS